MLPPTMLASASRMQAIAAFLKQLISINELLYCLREKYVLFSGSLLTPLEDRKEGFDRNLK